MTTPTDETTTPKRPEVPDEFPIPGMEEIKRPGLLERVFSVLKRSKSQLPSDSIFSSAVGFYAANATMLAAAIIGMASHELYPDNGYVCTVCIYVKGTPLGDKTTEVAQKVATDTAEGLKKAAAALDRDIPGKRDVR